MKSAMKSYAAMKPRWLLSVFLWQLALAFSLPGLDGQWTRLLSNQSSSIQIILHDSVRVLGDFVGCEHGGWRDMKELPCSFTDGNVTTLPNSEMVALQTNPGD
jgi:hypothetical protein